MDIFLKKKKKTYTFCVYKGQLSLITECYRTHLAYSLTVSVFWAICISHLCAGGSIRSYFCLFFWFAINNIFVFDSFLYILMCKITTHLMGMSCLNKIHGTEVPGFQQSKTNLLISQTHTHSFPQSTLHIFFALDQWLEQSIPLDWVSGLLSLETRQRGGERFTPREEE